MITGSTHGLGLAVARAYARAGAAVVISNHVSADVERAVAELRAEGARVAGQVCDVRDRAQVEALAAYADAMFGCFDIWINNAGVTATQGPSADIEPEKFVRVIHTNILGTYHGSIAALHRFVPRGGGKLINMVGRGDRSPQPFQNAYASSKAWIRTFTLALAAEYRRAGVGVFTFNPGLTYTALTGRVEVVEGFEQRGKAFKILVRLLGQSPDLPARKLVWLASAATDGQTGKEINLLTGPLLLRTLLREGVGMLLHRPSPADNISVHVVPPAIKSHSR